MSYIRSGSNPEHAYAYSDGVNTYFYIDKEYITGDLSMVIPSALFEKGLKSNIYYYSDDFWSEDGFEICTYVAENSVTWIPQTVQNEFENELIKMHKYFCEIIPGYENMDFRQQAEMADNLPLSQQYNLPKPKSRMVVKLSYNNVSIYLWPVTFAHLSEGWRT